MKRRNRLFSLLLAAVMLLSCVRVSAATTSTQVVQNAQALYDGIRRDYGGISGYVNVLNNQKLGYQQTLNQADFYNQAYHTVVDFGSTCMTLLGSLVTGGVLGTFEAVGSEAVELLMDNLIGELPKVTLEEYVYGLAREGASQASLSRLMEVGFHIEDDCGGKFGTVADAVEFITAVQNIKMGFAAMQLGRGYYYDQLNASPLSTLWDMFTNTTLEAVGDKIARDFPMNYAAAESLKMVYQVLRSVAGSIGNQRLTDYTETIIALCEETKELISFTKDDFGKTAPPAQGGTSSGGGTPSGGGSTPGGSSSGNTPSEPPKTVYVERQYYCNPEKIYQEGYYTGEWRSGAPEGWGKIEYADVNGDGKRYAITSGNQTYYAISYEGQFSGGLRSGAGTTTYEGGFRDEGTYYGAWAAGKTVFDGKRWLCNDRYNGYWPWKTVAANAVAVQSETVGAWVSAAPATFTLSYDANGGTKAPEKQTKTKGQTLTLCTGKPVRDGYTFLGWSVSRTAAAADYAPGSSFTKDSDTVLYAVWKKNEKGAQVLLVRLEGTGTDEERVVTEYRLTGYATGEAWLTFEDVSTGERTYCYGPVASQTETSVSSHRVLRPGRSYLVYFSDNYGKGAVISNSVRIEIAHSRKALLYDTPSVWAQDAVTEACDLDLVPDYLLRDYSAHTTRMDFVRLCYSVLQNQLGWIQQELYDRKLVPDLVTGPALVFTDVPENCGMDQYDSYRVAAMNALGIVNGVGGGRFAPEREITRQEAAALLSRVYAFLQWGEVQPYSCQGSRDQLYADNGDIAAWAQEDVYNMRALNVMNGSGGNRFSPQGLYTVEQSITTFVRLLACQ